LFCSSLTGCEAVRSHFAFLVRLLFLFFYEKGFRHGWAFFPEIVLMTSPMVWLILRVERPFLPPFPQLAAVSCERTSCTSFPPVFEVTSSSPVTAFPVKRVRRNSALSKFLSLVIPLLLSQAFRAFRLRDKNPPLCMALPFFSFNFFSTCRVQARIESRSSLFFPPLPQ